MVLLPISHALIYHHEFMFIVSRSVILMEILFFVILICTTVDLSTAICVFCHLSWLEYISRLYASCRSRIGYIWFYCLSVRLGNLLWICLYGCEGRHCWLGWDFNRIFFCARISAWWMHNVFGSLVQSCIYVCIFKKFQVK